MKVIPMGGRYNANPQEIMLMQADENYTKVYFSNGQKLTVATTLKILEQRFADCLEFFRTHKSYMVNIRYIKNFDTNRRDVFMLMNNGYRFEVSRRKKRAFKERISTISQNI
jgi:DNA-binding LytR/AlgR family response regulator